METWQELKVTVKREGEELVSNLLIELGAQGVAIEDSMDYVGNVDRFGEIFPDVEQQEEIVVTAYYPETVDVAAVEADLQARLAELTDFMDLGESQDGGRLPWLRKTGQTTGRNTMNQLVSLMT